jgi:hypothetical protein
MVRSYSGRYSHHYGTFTRKSRHGATSRKVTGSISDGVSGIFHLHNPSDRTLALGSTLPLTEMSARNISWCGRGEWGGGVDATDAQGWQPYHLHVPIFLKSGSLNLLEPSGPVKACNGIALPLPYLLLLNKQFERTKYKPWCRSPYYKFQRSA